jgi:hypothetical protein
MQVPPNSAMRTRTCILRIEGFVGYIHEAPHSATSGGYARSCRPYCGARCSGVMINSCRDDREGMDREREWALNQRFFSSIRQEKDRLQMLVRKEVTEEFFKVDEQTEMIGCGVFA